MSGAFLGNRGQSYFYNGTGSAPGADADLRVTGPPGAPGETHTITYGATAVRAGSWVNGAELSSAAVFADASSGPVSTRYQLLMISPKHSSPLGITAPYP